MSQAVRQGRGGVIEAHFLGGRPTSVTVTVCDGDGEVKVDGQAATLETVNTTLSDASAAGDLDLSLVSATGVVVGRRYLVGTANGRETPEAVTVRGVTGSIATLSAPLMRDHSGGASFAGTRASYEMDADETEDLWWDGYADWVPDTGEVVTEVVECCLRPIPRNLIDETDVRLVWADAAMILPATLDMPAALLEARDEFLRRLGGKYRANVVMGTEHFRRPCALLFWIMRGHELGEAHHPQLDRMGDEVAAILENIARQTPTDNDQDGKTTAAADGGYASLGGRRP